MDRTTFLKSAFDKFIEHDLTNMRYFFKEPYYFKVIDSESSKDVFNNVTNDMNEFFDELGINKQLSTLAGLEFCQPRLAENYYGVCVMVDFNDLYDELIQEGVINKPENKEKMFRIENKQGLGFYRHLEEKGDSLSSKISMDVSNTPSPMEDGLLVSLFRNPNKVKKREEYLFGFESQEQAALWIVDEERIVDYIILDEDLYFAEYEVDSSQTIKGNKQMVCHLDHLKLKNRITLQEALDGQKELLLHKKKLENNSLDEKDKNEILTFLKNKNGTVDIIKKKKRKNTKKDNNNNDRQMPLF